MQLRLKIPKLSPPDKFGCSDLTFSAIQLRDNQGKFLGNFKIDKSIIDIIGDSIKNGNEIILNLPISRDPTETLSEDNLNKFDERLYEDLKKRLSPGTT